MIVLVNRSGPPEAMICPAIYCEVCNRPVNHQGNAVWYEYDSTELERTPVYYVHKGCARAFEREHCKTCSEQHGGYCRAHYRWYDLPRFLDHLAHNFAHPFKDDPAVKNGSAFYREPKLHTGGS
jgi:hypothetical protein